MTRKRIFLRETLLADTLWIMIKVFVMTRVFFSRGFAGRAFGLRTKMCDGKEENSGTQVSSPASRSTKQSGALRVFLT